MKKIVFLIATVLLFQNVSAQLHLSAYGGLAITAGSNECTPRLDNGMAYGLQLAYRIPSVEGLAVTLEADILKSMHSSVPETFAAGDTALYASSYRFIPFLLGVNYLWQFVPQCGLSTHIGVGLNHRSIPYATATGITGTDNGTTFAYRVGLDLVFVKHLSLGFRFMGLGNGPQYESVPTQWDANGTPIRYENRQVSGNSFGQNFFTLLVGVHL